MWDKRENYKAKFEGPSRKRKATNNVEAGDESTDTISNQSDDECGSGCSCGSDSSRSVDVDSDDVDD